MTCCATVRTSRISPALCCRPAVRVARPVPADWARWLDWTVMALLGAFAGLAGVWSLARCL